jgi:hypothetical protein
VSPPAISLSEDGALQCAAQYTSVLPSTPIVRQQFHKHGFLTSGLDYVQNMTAAAAQDMCSTHRTLAPFADALAGAPEHPLWLWHRRSLKPQLHKRHGFGHLQRVSSSMGLIYT